MLACNAVPSIVCSDSWCRQVSEDLRQGKIFENEKKSSSYTLLMQYHPCCPDGDKVSDIFGSFFEDNWHSDPFSVETVGACTCRVVSMFSGAFMPA